MAQIEERKEDPIVRRPENRIVENSPTRGRTPVIEEILQDHVDELQKKNKALE